MAADVLHVGLGVSYTASTILYAIVLISVFVVWRGDLCHGNRSRRLHRVHPAPGILAYGRTLRRDHHRPRRRLPLAAMERCRILLIRVRDHPAPWCLDRRRPGQTKIR